MAVVVDMTHKDLLHQVWVLHKEETEAMVVVVVDMEVEVVDMVVVDMEAAGVVAVATTEDMAETEVVMEAVADMTVDMVEVVVATVEAVVVMVEEETEEVEEEEEDGIGKTILLPTRRSKSKWMNKPPACFKRRTRESTLMLTKIFLLKRVEENALHHSRHSMTLSCLLPLLSTWRDASTQSQPQCRDTLFQLPWQEEISWLVLRLVRVKQRPSVSQRSLVFSSLVSHQHPEEERSTLPP